MIKPHTTAKLQQTKLLGIRGEEKVNERERERGNEKKKRERRGKGEKTHKEKKSLWWLLSTILWLKTITTGMKQSD